MKAILFNKKEFSKLFPVTNNATLATKYSVAESTIRLWGSQLNLNKQKWLWSDKETNYLLAHAEKDRTFPEIAVALGRTKWSVYNKWREIKTSKNVK